MSSLPGDIISLSFIIVLILMSSTFSIALIDEKRRKLFGIIAGILTGVAVGFMIVFMTGFIFFPEPII